MARKRKEVPSGAEWAALGRIHTWLMDNGLSDADADEFAWTYIWMIVLRHNMERTRRALVILAVAVAVMAAVSAAMIANIG